MLLSALLLAVVTPAGDRPPPDPEIVVSGERGRTVRDRTSEFVQTIGVGAGEVPAARWIERYCPQVVGLSQQQTRQVERRLREVARLVRAPLAPSGCTGNALIAFTTDARREMAIVARKQGGLRNSNSSPAEASSVINATGPARWWYSSEYRSSDGAAALDVPHPALSTGTGIDGVGMSLTISGAIPQQGSSNVSTKQMRGITGATVMLQVGPDMPPLSALADYAALLSLAEVQSGARSTGSILDLFGRPELYPALTELDLSFLTALYRVKLDRRGHRQRKTIIGEMTRQIERSDGLR